MNLAVLFILLLIGLSILIGSFISIPFNKHDKINKIIIIITLILFLINSIFRLIPFSFNILNDEVGVIRTVLAMIILLIMGYVLFKVFDLIFKKDYSKYNFSILISISLILFNILEGINTYILFLDNINISEILLLCILYLFIGYSLHYYMNKVYTNKKSLNISLIISFCVFVGGFIVFINHGLVNHLTVSLLTISNIGMFIYTIIYKNK